ncbi:MAG: hypothetical protein V3W52_17125 [Syntrophobacteria bacterium]
MEKITEMIPSDMPNWAKKAMREGQFFRVAIEKVETLTDQVEALCKGHDASMQIMDEMESAKQEGQGDGE